MVNIVSQWILTLLIIVPLLGGLLLFGLSNKSAALQRGVAVGITVLEAILSLHLVAYFVPNISDLQFAQVFHLLPAVTGINYIVAVDGLSLLFVITTTILFPFIILGSFGDLKEKSAAYLGLLLMLESAILGSLLAVDLFLFYTFFELMLIPMFFIIGIWGGKEKTYAATKFFIYTALGSLLMLVAFGYLYYIHGSQPGQTYTTNIIELYRTSASLPVETQAWLFGATALAFGIKTALFPLHTWLPDAYTQAPTAGTVSAVLMKMGMYGFLRISIPMFPQAAHMFAPLMIGLAVAGIIYGALIAFRLNNLKQIIAFSSVSHLGFIVAGFFSFTEQGLTGGLYQTMNHSLTTGALFLLVGALAQRRGSLDIRDYGGLARVVPLLAFFVVIATVGSVALPGTGSFIGEWLILWGVFSVHPVLGVLAATGVIFSALYMLRFVMKVFWGPVTHEANKTLPDLTPRETFVFAVLGVAIFVTGFASAPILEHSQTTLVNLSRSAGDKSPYKTRLLFTGTNNSTAEIRVDGSEGAK